MFLCRIFRYCCLVVFFICMSFGILNIFLCRFRKQFVYYIVFVSCVVGVGFGIVKLRVRLVLCDMCMLLRLGFLEVLVFKCLKSSGWISRVFFFSNLYIFYFQSFGWVNSCQVFGISKSLFLRFQCRVIRILDNMGFLVWVVVI